MGDGWTRLDPGSAHAAPLAAAPIGHSSISNYDFGQNVLHNNAKTTIAINGAGSPGATSDAVASRMGQINSDLLRNFHGAAQ